PMTKSLQLPFRPVITFQVIVQRKRVLRAVALIQVHRPRPARRAASCRLTRLQFTSRSDALRGAAVTIGAARQHSAIGTERQLLCKIVAFSYVLRLQQHGLVPGRFAVFRNAALPYPNHARESTGCAGVDIVWLIGGSGGTDDQGIAIVAQGQAGSEAIVLCRPRMGVGDYMLQLPVVVQVLVQVQGFAFAATHHQAVAIGGHGYAYPNQFGGWAGT